jgi:hypothetical protein
MNALTARSTNVADPTTDILPFEKSMKLLPIIALSAAIIGMGAGCVRTPPTTTGTAAPKPIATTPPQS